MNFAPLRAAASAFTTCLTLVALLPGVALAGTLRVDVLEVGQGDSILIRSPAGKTILIDAGDGKIDVPPILQKEGVTSLDLVIGSHPHADHIGGMDDVVQGFPIKRYLDNGLPHTTATYRTLMADLEEKGIAYQSAVRDTVFNLDDGARLEVLFPAGIALKNTRSDLNSNSVVVRLTHQGHCMLFVGDSEEPTEQALLDGGLGKCDLLKVAHHGSNHSSTSAFLRAVQPTYALISVGVDNRYKHPGSETLARLAGAGAKIHRTDLEGQLTVLSSEKGLTVKGARPAPLPSSASFAEVSRVLGKGLPGKGEEGGDAMSDSAEGGGKHGHGAAHAAAAASGPVNLNTATAEQLEGLPGIGPSKVQAILAWRAEHGRFTSTQQLDEVKGIGPSILAQILPLVTVDGASSAPVAAPAGTKKTAPVGPPTPGTPAPENFACPFPASPSSQVFHEASCGNAKKLNPDTAACYATREAAIAAGKRPAGCCKP